MDERLWQKRTLCTAATTAAAPHCRIYLVFFRPMSIKWEKKKKHVCAQIHTHTQKHNTTTSQVFLFFDEKRRGRVGGEARNNTPPPPKKKIKKSQMESDTSSGIRGAHFIFWCLPVSMTTAALTGRAYGAALPAGGNNV